MSKIVVCGLLNIETTVAVEKFPVEYNAINYSFFGVNSAPSGVGLNLALALNTLGDDVSLLSLCGDDLQAKTVKEHLLMSGIKTDNILSTLKETPQSVVLYDKNGKREIFCDLKDSQDAEYNTDIFKSSVQSCDAVCLCNINFARNLLPVAKEYNKPIVTDVHVISNIEDEYNKDFMQYADILFMSNENIANAREFIKDVEYRYGTSVIVMGMGSRGALLYTKSDGKFTKVPAVKTRQVKNTVGAGDALLSAFTHFYIKGYTAYDSLRFASVFSSYKIGDKSASSGFLAEEELISLAVSDLEVL